MINLLPPTEKTALKREESRKIILTLEIVFFLALISLALILFAIQIYISAQSESQGILVSQEETGLMGTKGLQKKINQINLSLSRVDSFYQEQPQITFLFEGIARTLPEGIYLTSFNYLPQPELIKISLSGFSTTREILLEFKNKLEKQEAISEVYFPPITWTESTDIDWSCNFKLRKNFRLYFIPATNEYQLK